MKEKTKFSQFSLKLSRVSLLPISILHFTRATPLFIVWGCWKIGGKIQIKLIWNSHQKQVPWEVWPFSTMTPPKNYTYTYSPKSHGQCDFILHIHTPLFNIHTSYKSKSNDVLLFNAWPCPSWDGLGLFGLGLSWAWAWASSLFYVFF